MKLLKANTVRKSLLILGIGLLLPLTANSFQGIPNLVKPGKLIKPPPSPVAKYPCHLQWAVGHCPGTGDNGSTTMKTQAECLKDANKLASCVGVQLNEHPYSSATSENDLIQFMGGKPSNASPAG